MNLSIEQKSLIAEAETWVKRFIQERGEFQMFSLAKHKDGKTNPIQPTDEFPDQRSALVETIQVLMALARDGEIVGNALCTPMSEGKERMAILDVEVKGKDRVLVFLPYKKRIFGGWAFGEKQFKIDAPKLFVS